MISHKINTQNINSKLHLAMSNPLYFMCALSIIFMTCYGDSSSISSICAPSDCGNGVPIHYPFWKRSSTTTTAREFCGYPEFGLNCSKDGQPILQLKTDTYYVTDINYDNHSITLVDIDVVNQSCPRAKHNVSLGNFPLSFSHTDMNIGFYFNCSSHPFYVDLDPIKCLKNSVGKQSYVLDQVGQEIGGYDWNCQDEVVVTVKQDEVPSGGLITGFGAAMNKGFVLDWSRAVDCAECELSEGYCGYNETTKQSMCICRDSSIVAKSCKKGSTLLSAY